MVKVILLIVAAGIGYMIYTGNMGGAKSATGNYIKVRQNATSNGNAKPSPLVQMIEYNNKKKGKE